jgi:hypothetical protein
MVAIIEMDFTIMAIDVLEVDTIIVMGIDTIEEDDIGQEMVYMDIIKIETIIEDQYDIIQKREVLVEEELTTDREV